MLKTAIIVSLVAFQISCARRIVRTTLECDNPDRQLNILWGSLQEARTADGGCPIIGGADRCEQIHRQIERLSFLCPGNTAALMANAILAYDAKQLFKAQQFLDELLSKGGLNPAAAALRSRVAIDEGNLPYATRFLQEQTRLNPDHAELREMLAATLFLTGQYPEAENQLDAAARLGTPRWRIAYHLGLIAEARGLTTNARELYEEALQLKPGWTLPESRLKGLFFRPPTR